MFIIETANEAKTEAVNEMGKLEKAADEKIKDVGHNIDQTLQKTGEIIDTKRDELTGSLNKVTDQAGQGISDSAAMATGLLSKATGGFAN